MLALETFQGPRFGTYGASVFFISTLGRFWKDMAEHAGASKELVTSSTTFDAFIPQSLHSYFPPHQFHRDTSHLYESPLKHLKTFNIHNIQ